MSKTKLYINSRGRLFDCAVKEGVKWETAREKTPGKLTFEVAKDDWENFGFHEGDAVRFEYDGQKVFFGFVFTKKRKDNRFIEVTAYDQLRYLKNKDTYVYENKTAAQVLQMIAKDFGLKTGAIEGTNYVIPSRVEDNQELFSIIANALLETVQHTGKSYVLYDDFGKLSLKNIESMKSTLLIDETSGESFDYESSIDEDVYNRVKLICENKKTKERKVIMAQANVGEWGILQLTEKVDDTVNAQARANGLLKLHKNKKRKLHMKDVFGDVTIRGGSSLAVSMYLGDITVANYMVVDNVKHTFLESHHKMDLALIGGDFSA